MQDSTAVQITTSDVLLLVAYSKVDISGLCRHLSNMELLFKARTRRATLFILCILGPERDNLGFYVKSVMEV